MHYEYGIRAALEGKPELLKYMKTLSKDELAKKNKALFKMRLAGVPATIMPTAVSTFLCILNGL